MSSLYIIIPTILGVDFLFGYLYHKYLQKKNEERIKLIKEKTIKKETIQSNKSEYLTTPYRRKYRNSFYDYNGL